MEFERRLVVAGHDAKVGAVGLCVAEVAEIAQGEPDQHWHVGSCTGDVGAGRRRVQAEFLAEMPVAVPPRAGGAGERRKAYGEQCERCGGELHPVGPFTKRQSVHHPLSGTVVMLS